MLCDLISLTMLLKCILLFASNDLTTVFSNINIKHIRWKLLIINPDIARVSLNRNTLKHTHVYTHKDHVKSFPSFFISSPLILFYTSSTPPPSVFSLPPPSLLFYALLFITVWRLKEILLWGVGLERGDRGSHTDRAGRTQG